jgi:malate dehydrogenase (oxaloacetate-decarboxylating)(NADP+)
VAVISNGTAVLGLGNIGPLAAKPVMEGKAVLFKKFADIDVFDIEIDAPAPQAFIATVARLEPTFGGINLEDIKAPECFEIEEALRSRMKIPVFHDDQHGTAIIVAAAITNALRVVDKDIKDVRLVASGAGAAAIACLNLLVSLGLARERIFVTDLLGVVYKGRRELMDRWKEPYAQDTPARTLNDIIDGADIFLGLSAPNVLQPEMVQRMAPQPIILALANPVPEIMPDVAKAARPDAVIATGRSDFPNQVNNVLCFPFIFRGALDVGATTINEAMKIACVHAIAELALAEPSDIVARAYGGEQARFGPDKLIPKPFDPRLLTQIAPAVAQAAIDSGVATRPITDFDAYRARLTQFVFKSGLLMKPLYDQARANPKRLIYAEGEERRVLQAAQQVIDEGMALPILVGRAQVIENRIEELGLRMRPGRDVELVNILQDPRFYSYWNQYHAIMGRRGVSPRAAKRAVRSDNTVVAALALQRGEADALLCGVVGRFRHHLKIIEDVIGKRADVIDLSTVSALILPSGTFFICDTHITPEPSGAEIVEMTLLAAAEVRALGLEPKVALLSRSNFGSHDTPAAIKMQAAIKILHQRAPQLQVDGEMQADAALAQEIRDYFLPGSRLRGQANLLIMPDVEAANIAYNLLKMLGGGVTLGPILLGAAKPAHIVTQAITVRGLVNMSALAVAQVAIAGQR